MNVFPAQFLYSQSDTLPSRKCSGFAWVFSVCILILTPCQVVAQTPAAALKPVIRVGIERGNSPLSHLDENGKTSGYIVDLMRAIALERNFEISLDYRPWNDLLTDFKAGKIDVLANMVYTPERESFVNFSVAHLTLPGAVIVRSDNRTIRTVEDLKTHRLATSRQGYTYEFATKNGFGSSILETNSLEESLAALSKGKADYLLAVRVFVEATTRNKKMRNITTAPIAVPGLRFQFHVAVRKGLDDLLYDINSGLLALRINGTHDELYEKWLGPLEPRKLRFSDLRPYIAPALILVLAISYGYWYQLRLLRRLRSQAEELKRSEERLTLVLEGSQDAFWDWDVVNNNVTLSDRWTVMVGSENISRSGPIELIDSLIHPDDLLRVQTSRERLLKEGHSQSEYRLRSRNDHWLWLHDRGKVVARDASGQPARVTGAVSDITTRKRIEEALGRSQALLEQSQRAADIGGWEYDAINNVLYWTLQAFRIHDLDHDAGSPTLEQFFGFHRQAAQPTIRKAFQTALENGQGFDLELELLTANQRPIWVRTIGRAEKDASRVVRIYGSYQDITYRKKAEDERQKIQSKMLEAQKLESLGVLAGGIAHDFNNILTVIMGNASIAREDPQCAPDALMQIETAAQRAADLCRQMLAYAGRNRTSTVCTDLNQIVSETVHLLRLSISKNATLDFILDPQPLPVEVDISQIRQVIMNLVINASDAFGEATGRIRVMTSRIQTTPNQMRDARLGQDLPPGEYIAFEVQDEGCGMSADTLARIFDPFFTTKFTGRGLGLAAVLGIVRAHQGAFFVESKLSRGSTFRMLLPPTTKPLPEKSRVSEDALAAPTGTSRFFLVVDDEPEVRKLAANILERQGHQVALASDGYEALALALARGDRYTAILLDLTMPGLDGPSTLRELRQMKLKVPVLIMSGYSEFDVRQRFPQDPLLGFLPKPFNSADLQQRLNELLDRAEQL